jgi:hypothetical protein
LRVFFRLEALQGYAISPPLPLAQALELWRTNKAALCDTRFPAAQSLYIGIISRLRETVWDIARFGE